MENKLLQDILQELKSIKQGQDTMSAEIKTLKQGQDTMSAEIKTLKQGQDTMSAEIKTLKQGQDTMSTEMRSGFEGVNKKLDTIYAQVAHNTEQEIKLNEVIAKVEFLETDNKLIKKLIVNQ